MAPPVPPSRGAILARWALAGGPPDAPATLTGASTGWSPAVIDNAPIYRATVSLPPGLDETRLLVVDERGDRIAETVWRPDNASQSGPADWDWKLHALRFERRSPWKPDELFWFAADVTPITMASESEMTASGDARRRRPATPT
jgi:hypothetical protein